MASDDLVVGHGSGRALSEAEMAKAVTPFNQLERREKTIANLVRKAQLATIAEVRQQVEYMADSSGDAGGPAVWRADVLFLLDDMEEEVKDGK